MNPVYFLFLLLPLAFLSGWLTARHGRKARLGDGADSLSSDYFRGLNYLLNEEQDKAIEVFLRLAEYDSDTIETHLALGNLFRRRGEVDRAIRVHQNLVSRPNLNDETKAMALLELGEDYMRAGLLDRAETLFGDLAAMSTHAPAALRHLIAIYQHERDWHEAINQARRLETMSGESQTHAIAHFYCELAEQSLRHGARQEAKDYLDKAFASNGECVRAYMLKGQMQASEENHAAVVDTCEHAIGCEISYIPEVLPQLLVSYEKSGQMERAERFLRDVIAQYHGVSPVLALAEIYGQRDGKRAAIDFLTAQLRKRPSVRGMMALINATMEHTSGEVQQDFLILRDLTRKLLDGQAMYRCNHCGFSAKAHHWQCPSCKLWGSVRPIHGVANE